MVAVALLTLGPPVLVLGLRLLFHAIDPAQLRAGWHPERVRRPDATRWPSSGSSSPPTVGAAAGTTDLTDGVFRHLVITGRSRLALYLARIPAGLAILLPVVAVAFAMVCLVTSYEGVPHPTAVSVNGVSIPVHLDQAQLQSWVRQHPRQAAEAFASGPAPGADGTSRRPASSRTSPPSTPTTPAPRPASSIRPVNEMAKIGLWLELEVGVGFIVGLGFGSLTGQRTVSTIVLIALEIIVTPILASPRSPTSWTASGLSSASRMDQLRPAGLARRAAAAAPVPGRAAVRRAAEPSAYRRCRPGR